MSAKHTTSHHADWLSLVEVSGPFVSMPVLKRVFPQGLEPRDPAQAKALRAACEEWQDNPTAPGRQSAWVRHILTSVLGYPEKQIATGQAIPAGLEAALPEMGETLRPDLALVGPTGSDTAGRAQLLIVSYPAEQALEKSVSGQHWKATPATRMMELLHGAGVPLGLVTNGEHWLLVYAPRGETTGFASWYASLWLDEPITLRAFHSLLGVRRFFGVAADSTLLAMLHESANDQQEVTDQLGYQVREAVEVLVQSLEALDKESHRALLKGVAETTLYDAALTVMMRLVFLFSAEERGLLHLGKPLYDDNYAVSTLQEQLQATADQHGEEVLERRSDSWARLLATFRAVYGGIPHQDLLLPAYGGSLFDPDRYPFLEGRAVGSKWRSIPAEPLAVNNRVVLHLLNSLQRLRTKDGGAAETRRISFRALDVEQIGHVYEGLLDHTAVRANEPVLGLRGTRNKEPEIPLAALETARAQGPDALIDFLKEKTGRSAAALRKALEDDRLLDEHKLLMACGQDEKLLKRLRPFANLIRDDSFERPLVVLTGSVYVTAGTARRSTGTHYTPPSLTHPIVRRTLEPLVYEGPAEGWPREKWQLRSPKELLALKVCDMAMGSGAFLVQACRYLAERLVEAWEIAEGTLTLTPLSLTGRGDGGEGLKPRITPEGAPATGAPSERLIPDAADERMAIARRIVADRCLYGVDKNPMAVEMAKLSLWLVTLAKDRPFTFLDHAFKCGDSLVGADEAMFLRWAHNYKDAAATLFDAELQKDVAAARAKRRELESFDVRDVRDMERKTQLLAEADATLQRIKLGCDLLIGVRLLGLKPKEQEKLQNTLLFEYMANTEMKSADAQRALAPAKQVRTFHWPFEFPEVFEQGGFSAFMSNPPFIGGQRISGAFGDAYLDYLKTHWSHTRGSADICAYFFLRAFENARRGGTFGLIATNTIAQGDTRQMGLDFVVNSGGTIYNAVPSMAWPGVAAVFVSVVHIIKGAFVGDKQLADKPVAIITALLDSAQTQTLGDPKRLATNADKSFQGSNVLGMGFVLTTDEAQALINKSPKNKVVLFPFLNGEDLNSRPDQSPSRWVINFFDWSLEQAKEYPDCFERVQRLVKPEREKQNREIRKKHWWRYGEIAPKLYRTIAPLQLVLAIAQTSKTLAFTLTDPNIVFSHATVVLALDGYDVFCLLQSNLHIAWVVKYASWLKTDARYLPSDCFETFPFPKSPIANLQSLEILGESYHEHRKHIMLARQEGLTKTYNRFHNPQETSADINELRRLHVEMDRAVAAAYGWQDLELGHGFHETAQGVRYTLSESARREVLARLLKLNHERWEEEQAQTKDEGPNTKDKRTRKKKDSLSDDKSPKLF